MAKDKKPTDVLGISEDLDAMSADELEGLLQSLNNEQSERRAAIVAVHAVYDKKRESEQALAKLGNLSESELEAVVTAAKTQIAQVSSAQARDGEEDDG